MPDLKLQGNGDGGAILALLGRSDGEREAARFPECVSARTERTKNLASAVTSDTSEGS